MVRGIACLFLSASLLFAEDALEQAWNLAAHDQRPLAIQVLQELLTKQPSNADARILLGSLLMEANQPAESIEQLTVAGRLRPRSFEAANALGEAYSKFGNLAPARAAFEKAVALKPDYGIAQLNLGQTLLALNDAPAATKHLDEAIRLLNHTDEAADARYLRAKLFASSSDPASSAKLLEQAVAIRPNFAAAWSDLGQMRRTLLDDKGALMAFKHAVAADPHDSIAQGRLGTLYLAQNDPQSAVECLQKARQLLPNDQSVLNSLQIALRQAGRAEEAAQVKQQLADLLRNKDIQRQNRLTAIKRNNEGAEKEKSGDLPAALELYRQAAGLYPEHAGIHKNYGVALLRTGQWTAGLEQLHTSLELDPANLEVRVALSDALAQVPASLKPSWTLPASASR